MCDTSNKARLAEGNRGVPEHFLNTSVIGWVTSFLHLVHSLCDSKLEVDMAVKCVFLEQDIYTMQLTTKCGTFWGTGTGFAVVFDMLFYFFVVSCFVYLILSFSLF